MSIQERAIDVVAYLIEEDYHEATYKTLWEAGILYKTADRHEDNAFILENLLRRKIIRSSIDVFGDEWFTLTSIGAAKYRRGLI